MPEPRLIDVRHLGRARVIGAWVVDEEVLVDPGPAISTDELLAQLGEWRPRAIALTHVHLDHAGATGTLLRRWPGTEVWVHEAGARHLADPARLLAGSRQIYGDDLERLWGETLPVPAEVIRPLQDGDRVGPFDVLATPGHAPHHVTFLDRHRGWAFLGDVGGIRIAPCRYVLPPTVPPRTDVEAWVRSLARLAERRPSVLAPTHFGAHTDAETHLEAARVALLRMAEEARRRSKEAFVGWLDRELMDLGAPCTPDAYRQIGRLGMLWDGLQGAAASPRPRDGTGP
ncbi:MAG TPA: MBL fold metallo-hydrolase [Candidatus Dormibacteraeota bacterium]|nr:MBL fold metallo-hydrolase [Acidimicrobiales bacterium]HLH69049.1 MBL fold metallo-hydrolase [Candidatus Dormibacteraeota bacterium]